MIAGAVPGSSSTVWFLSVASDRISTFDVVLPTEIPDKGRVLTGLSAFWFARTREIVPNHVLAVRDDGPGLDQDAKAHVFDRYYTRRSAAGGSGIGLSVVRAIVEAHGGHVDVASEPAKGSTFTLTLPSLAAEIDAE